MFCLGQSKVIEINIGDNTSTDVNIQGGDSIPLSTGFIPDALPEVKKLVSADDLQSGVSTHNAPLPKELQEKRRAARTPRWYILRCTYGREKKSAEYLKTHNVKIYCPTTIRVKLVGGKKKSIEESFFPNFIFVFGVFDNLKAYVYNNEHRATKPLRFYCRHFYKGTKKVYEPIAITEKQMESIRKTCSSSSDDIIISQTPIGQFKKGRHVRVIDGKFKGVEGIVARYHKQQRVAIIIDGFFTVITAYVPSAFLEEIQQ